MREADVQAAFVAHLSERGWDVATENPDHVDVHARRGAERIVAEVKGHTGSPGLDIDTMYGQLLRRMREEDRTAEVRYAVVVPESMAMAASRVPAWVRAELSIEIVLVDESSTCRTLVSHPLDTRD